MLSCPHDVAEVHAFRIDGTAIAFDVNSGNAFLLDELAWEVLERCRSSTHAEILRSLSCRYPRREIETALVEFGRLEAKQQLFSPPWDEPLYPTTELDIASITLNVSHDCNLACRYCYASAGSFGGERGLMSAQTAEEAIEFLIQHSEHSERCEVCFFGGEPLLNYPVIEKTVAYAEKRFRETGHEGAFHVTTNGTLLTDEVIAFMDAHRFTAIVSLDGPPWIHDQMRRYRTGAKSHGDVLPRLEKLIAVRGNDNVTVRATFSAETLDLCEIYDYLADQNFQSVSVEPVANVPAGHPLMIRAEHLPRIKQSYRALAYDFYERIGRGESCSFFHLQLVMDRIREAQRVYTQCGAALGYVAVAPSGEIYPCHVLVGRRKYLLGSVHEGSLDPNIREKFMNAHLLMKPACAGCWARYHCGGGCHAIADCVHGNILDPDPIDCELTRCRIELGLLVYALLTDHAPDRLEQFYGEAKSNVPKIQQEALRGL